jgi:hypothetical protein
LVIALVTARLTAPRPAPRRAERFPESAIAAAIANHSLALSAARLSTGIAVSTKGLREFAIASNTSASRAPRPLLICRNPGDVRGAAFINSTYTSTDINRIRIKAEWRP